MSSTLFYYSQRLEMKAQVADAFIAKFQLTPDEMNLLRGTKDEPITEVAQWTLKALPWTKI